MLPWERFFEKNFSRNRFRTPIAFLLVPVLSSTYHTTNKAHSPPPKLCYLPNQTTMTPFKHTCIFSINWKMPKLKRTTVYCQTLIKNGTANGATSNAYLASSYVPFKTKCIIVKYRTGTLYKQKHALLFRLSTSQTCLLCPQLDNALYILSGCQHTQIRNMITERQFSMPHDH